MLGMIYIKLIIVGSFFTSNMECKELECKITSLGTEYKGQINVTIFGIRCQKWNTDIPHFNYYKDLVGDQENYCRNPDNTAGGPWCYTMDPAIRWEYCDVQYCVFTTPRTSTNAETTEKMPTTDKTLSTDRQTTTDGSSTSELQTTTDKTSTTELQTTTDKTSTTELQTTTDKTSTTELQTTTDKTSTTELQTTTDKTSTTELQTTTDKTSTTELQTTTDKTSTTELQITTDKTSTTELQITTDKTSTTELQITTDKTSTTELQTTTDKTSTTELQTTTDKTSITELQITTKNTLTTEFQTTNDMISITEHKTTVAVKPHQCFCPCGKKKLSEEELYAVIKELEKKLTVDKKTTSAYIRRHTSARDDRKSSVTIGAFGIVIVCVPVVLMTISDCIGFFSRKYR